MHSYLLEKAVPLLQIDLSFWGLEDHSLVIKREDLLHPVVSGNKFRKLKYNIAQAQLEGKNTLLTFGGAHSNHIAATAAAASELRLKSIGIIRGEELVEKPLNATLAFAKECGMHLHFVSRQEYRLKESASFIQNLGSLFGNFYLLPEGGTNKWAVKGCMEILDSRTRKFDHICCAVGTGGTLAGLSEAALDHQKVIGFSVLKGDFQKETVDRYSSRCNFSITDEYCFGGYGKIDRRLVRFINEFKEQTKIPLDPVYTGKMMYGIFDMMKRGAFDKNSRILAVHSGGLQGTAGMNEVLKRKQLPLIE